MIANKLALFVAFVLCVLTLVGCSDHRLGYFRQYGAPHEDARTDFGLCGGNYYDNGAPKEHNLKDSRIINCMNSKGYALINDYYRETLITWVKRGSENSVFFHVEELTKCGGRRLEKGICADTLFVLKSEFNEVNSCMERLDYTVSPPRRIGIRVFNKLTDVKSNFCIYLTPINEKGSVSFGHWKFE